MSSYIKLGVAALLPVAATVIFCLLERNNKVKKMNACAKQAVLGIVFGILAIIGTEWGIPMEGAAVNCRDAAVLTAGLFFGGPAGIIAGLLGGIERWTSVLWGQGYYTRTACSLATILAGFYAAFLRRYMFENRNPGLILSAAVAVVMEVVHMTMIFLTNMDSPIRALSFIKICTIPMVTANAVSLLLSGFAYTYLCEHDRLVKNRGKKKISISQNIQRSLVVVIAAAFAATSLFLFFLQDRMARNQADKLLVMSLDETEADINDTSDANLLKIAYLLSEEIGHGATDLNEIAERYDVAEINIVDYRGIIVQSTEKEFIGYDMHAGKQSSEFLCLLNGKASYVQKYGPISFSSSVSRKYAGIRYGLGFIQVGYDAVQFQQDIDHDIINITKNRHVGETGFIIIVDEQYNIVSAPDGLTMSTIKEYVSIGDIEDENVTFRTDFNGKSSWIRYRSAEGYHIISILPFDEAMQSRNVALYVNTFMEIIVFSVLFGLIYLLLKYVVVDKIKCFNTSLKEISEGNLDEVVDVRSTAEFNSLSDDINQTVDTLKHYIDEATKRIDEELEFAKNIQRSVLPGVNGVLSGRKELDVFASMDPAKEVGGDFYDFYLTDENRFNFMVADVSGKGIPAAMFMMRAKTQLKNLAEAHYSLSDIFTSGNNELCEGNEAGMFVTVWQGCIDLEKGIVQYVNAGHNPPLVKHADGSFDFIKERAGFVLAGIEGVRYKTQELLLTPGDIIFIYTDGVTEASNESFELYGNDRLLNTLNSAEYSTMQELCEYVRKDIDNFVGNAQQFDDITMMALQFKGKETAACLRFDEVVFEDIEEASSFAENQMKKAECSARVIHEAKIVIDEIFSNIVRYAYKEAKGPATIEFINNREQDSFSIRFTDEGVPYDPLSAPEPDITLSAEDRAIGGLGIFMVRKLTDDIKYSYENKKNILTITKKY